MSCFAGNNISGHNPASTVGIQSQAHTQPVSQKSFEKNWRPSKANNPGWSASVGAANNLVIRFSDDSSGSDSEENVEERAAESKANSSRVTGTRKPPPPPRSNTNKKNSAVLGKATPQRFSFNRALTSAATKVPGSKSGVGGGSLSAEQGSRVKNSSSFDKNVSNRESVSDRSMDLNSSKLQDLRQQIALRESELKLKSVQRNKESVPSMGDNATISLNTNAAKRFTATSSTSAQMEPKEPEKKRIKVGGSFSTQLKSVDAQEVFVGKSTLPRKEPAMQKNAMPISGSAKLDQSPKGNLTGRIESNIDERQKQNEKRVPGLSENIPARPKSGEQMQVLSL